MTDQACYVHLPSLNTCIKSKVSSWVLEDTAQQEFTMLNVQNLQQDDVDGALLQQNAAHQACMRKCMQIRHALTNECNGWFGSPPAALHPWTFWHMGGQEPYYQQ